MNTETQKHRGIDNQNRNSVPLLLCVHALIGSFLHKPDKKKGPLEKRSFTIGIENYYYKLLILILVEYFCLWDCLKSTGCSNKKLFRRIHWVTHLALR